MNFKDISVKYRPIPFWSWNEKLDINETRDQVQRMHEVGIGGFFMHARGGLQTDYMGKEWFSNVDAAVDIARKCDMHPWAYDENGWPSGFGNGEVNGLGVEYQQKYLRMSDTEPEDNLIAKSSEHYFYYDINPFYVDVLDKEVVAKFIEVAYLPYYEKYGNKIEGFFTDEPQISRDGIPWSFIFEKEYKLRYSDNIFEHLEELFLPKGEYKKTRIQFWKMVTDLFSQNYCKQIYDWCNERGLKLTGHLVLEESLSSQLTTNGACMPHYEYMHIPGMDWLGRNIYECLTPLQVSSVAEQLEKEQIISETFAMCGHNVSFAELKGIYEWQMVHGINLLCQHLEGYSLRGIRKRDYPPAMYYQQPWWSEYDRLIDALSRESMVLAEGRRQVKVLLLHPQTTAWALFDNNKNEGMAELEEKLKKEIKILEQNHIEFHLGDEIIMERHAKVENGRLIIGSQSYDVLITTCCEIVMPNTKRLIEEFKSSGGKILTAKEIETNNVTDNKEITYTKRVFDDFFVHYFVNTSNERKKAKINVMGKKLDIYTGERIAFGENYEFEPWGSLMVIDDGTDGRIGSNEKNIIHLDSDFKIVKPIKNVITLDRCDYYFDGVLQEKNGYVLNICERANELNRPIKIHQDYRIKINSRPTKLELVCETPQNFRISVNNAEIKRNIIGYFADKSFKVIDISEYITEGENTISFDCDFYQSNEFYSNFEKSKVFESEKNKLSYNMEIEAIYLIGDFCVKTDGIWTNLDKNAVRYSGIFEIDKPKTNIALKHIEQQGYPFFCGEMTIEGEIDIEGENPILEIDMKGINAVKVQINRKEKIMLTDNRVDLCDFGIKGKTKIQLTLINNLRNLLGPHHINEGESYYTSPGEFYKECCVWNRNRKFVWNDNYCFVEMSI